MSTHKINDTPGVGKYCCTATGCAWSVKLDDPTDKLPPCGNCGTGQNTMYEDC